MTMICVVLKPGADGPGSNQHQVRSHRATAPDALQPCARGRLDQLGTGSGSGLSSGSGATTRIE